MLGAGDAQITWQDYAAVIIRRRWFFIVPCAAVVAVAMAVGLYLPKVYRAEAVVLVQNPQIMNPLISGVAVSTDVQQRMRFVGDQLLSWTSLSRLVNRLGMDKDIHHQAELEDLIERVQKAIRVQFAGQGSLIKVQYDGPEPRLTQQVVNTITEVYLERNQEAQDAEAGQAIKFIEAELEVYKQKLEESEEKLREFKELHTMEMPIATQLNNQVISLEVQLAQLLVENTEEHPTVVLVKRQIHELKQRRNEELRRVIALAVAKGQNPEIYKDLASRLEAAGDGKASLDPAVRTARAAYELWVERLDNAAVGVVQPRPAAAPQAGMMTGAGQAPQSPFAAAGAGAVSLSLGPRQEQEMARLQRDTEVHQKTYQEMKQRLELAHVTQRLGQSEEGTKFKVLEPARLPLDPIFPNLWLFFFGSLLVGGVLGTTVAFGAEYLDNSFQSAADVQAVLALPVLGTISTIVTAEDVRARQSRMKGWVSVTRHLRRLKTYVLTPLWSRIDRTLVRLGL